MLRRLCTAAGIAGFESSWRGRTSTHYSPFKADLQSVNVRRDFGVVRVCSVAIEFVAYGDRETLYARSEPGEFPQELNDVISVRSGDKSKLVRERCFEERRAHFERYTCRCRDK